MHFGKDRKYVFFDYQTDLNDPFKIWYSKDRASEKIETRRKLLMALEKAEMEGRVVWRTGNEKRTWKKLNILLKLNGYRPLEVDQNKNYNKTEIILELIKRGETFIYIHD